MSSRPRRQSAAKAQNQWRKKQTEEEKEKENEELENEKKDEGSDTDEEKNGTGSEEGSEPEEGAKPKRGKRAQAGAPSKKKEPPKKNPRVDKKEPEPPVSDEEEEEEEEDEEDEEELEEKHLVFPRGTFLLRLEDVDAKRDNIWRVDEGLLLQKFQPLTPDDKLHYISTTNYTAWPGDEKAGFVELEVDAMETDEKKATLRAYPSEEQISGARAAEETSDSDANESDGGREASGSPATGKEPPPNKDE